MVMASNFSVMIFCGFLPPVQSPVEQNPTLCSLGIILACSRISKCWKQSALISHGRHPDLDSRVLVTFSCWGPMLFFIKFSRPRAEAALSSHLMFGANRKEKQRGQQWLDFISLRIDMNASKPPS